MIARHVDFGMNFLHKKNPTGWGEERADGVDTAITVEEVEIAFMTGSRMR